MQLNVDIGNSRIEIACMQNYKVVQKFSIDHRNTQLTYEENLNYIVDDLSKGNSNFSIDQIDAVCICSVVPKILESFTQSVKKVFNIDPFIVTYKSKFGLKLDVDYPEKVGNDRICDCAYAASVYNQPLLVIDIGTAIVINVVKDNCLLGGAILPGLQTSVRALALSTSQLESINISQPDSVIGKNTRDSINLGIVYGAAGAINKLAKQVIEKYKEDFKLIITGYSARFVLPFLDYDYNYEEDLTLKGIEYIYSLNH